MTKVTYDQTVEMITKIVQEHGEDHVYDDHDGDGIARYFNDGAPSCIVGHWIRALGDEEFESAVRLNEDEHDTFIAIELRDAAVEHGVSIEIEHDALKFLSAVQGLQDAGRSWGNALDGALHHMESGMI